MQFGRLAAIFFFFFSFSFLAVATPIGETDVAAVEKRQEALVITVLDTLQTTTGTILPELLQIVNLGNVTVVAITPLITELEVALTTASASLALISPLSIIKRQTEDQVANLTAAIVSDIATTLETVVTAAGGLPVVGALISPLDAALNQVLTGLETLLSGVLNLVATLLTDVAAILRNLSFSLTLGTLGL